MDLIQSLKKEGKKKCGTAEGSLASWLCGDARSSAWSHVCLSNVPFPWIALETCSIQQNPVKRFQILFNLHISDREHKCSSRRFVIQIMFLLTLPGIRIFSIFPGKTFLQEHYISSVYYLKFWSVTFLFFTQSCYYNLHFSRLLTPALLPHNHSQYLHKCTFISAFYSWQAFRFSL